MVRRNILPVGSVSSGTMREEDLIPAFLSAADDLRLTKTHRADVRAIQRKIALTPDYYDSEEVGDDLSYLLDLLGDYVPDYCYFGASTGDGADYGVWVSDTGIEEGIKDGDILVQDDASHGRKDVVPPDFVGFVLRVSDHGNRSLFRVVRNRWYEVW